MAVAPLPAAAELDSPDSGRQQAFADVEPVVERLRIEKERMANLLRKATALDERARLLARNEESLLERQVSAQDEADALSARAAHLREREASAASDAARVEARMVSLSISEARLEAERASLAEEAARLDERETRFAGRWRWLVQSWRRRRWRRDSMRVCDLLFVPTPDGYRLLEQSGVALGPGAILAGLQEQRRFFVSKIAPWPFDERLCAYLQEHDAQ